MENEIGKISNTRFVEVMEMGKYDGAGALSTDAVNDVDAANRYQTSNHYDVFPVLYVGTDSFGTVGFEGDVARVNTIMPKADAYNDPFGKKGAVSISWYFGMLIYRPERIRQIATAAQIS
jgi:N4-gp56 family major capsid protein